ncbi:uncharacterized protein BO80DRAFT_53701 [Aspergillus ibericus CBS 121593]|uniref:Uncharacterized protein n=1 Tax=Aspergillus ibericus CBS 121593 TaxID=1448316 RepID=A0A395H1E1_9EURO|nr:hypothetical protein BO80DRAFT_53701 [Aspergillus ibericus CBS 121593]RAL01657.1 hypothetical protein BO80DRAFT_53701 [Aspergillus ibericus CBS 121593]
MEACFLTIIAATVRRFHIDSTQGDAMSRCQRHPVQEGQGTSSVTIYATVELFCRFLPTRCFLGLALPAGLCPSAPPSLSPSRSQATGYYPKRVNMALPMSSQCSQCSHMCCYLTETWNQDSANHGAIVLSMNPISAGLACTVLVHTVDLWPSHQAPILMQISQTCHSPVHTGEPYILSIRCIPCSMLRHAENGGMASTRHDSVINWPSIESMQRI